MLVGVSVGLSRSAAKLETKDYHDDYPWLILI